MSRLSLCTGLGISEAAQIRTTAMVKYLLVDRVRSAPVILAIAYWGWLVGGVATVWVVSNLLGAAGAKAEAEKPAHDKFIGKVAEHEASKRFESWKVWNAIGQTLLIGLGVAFLVWRIFQ